MAIKYIITDRVRYAIDGETKDGEIVAADDEGFLVEPFGTDDLDFVTEKQIHCRTEVTP